MEANQVINVAQIFQKPILSMSEVALLLDKSIKTIRRYVDQDEIPYRKKKRSTYFITQEILEWIDNGD